MISLNDLTKKILAKHIDPRTKSPENILLGYQEASVVSEHISRYILAAKYAHGIVLDCAAGSCYGSSILNRSPATKWVISVDMDKDVLTYGRIVFDASCVCAVATNLPFKKECFNSVITIETIEHLKNPTEFIKNIFYCLNQEGTLLLTTPNKLYGSPFLQKPSNPYHITEYYLGSLIHFLKPFNFKIQQVYGGNKTTRLELIRRIVGSFSKFLLGTLFLKPYLIDDIYLSISSQINKNQLPINDLSLPEHVTLKAPSSNMITYQYIVIIASKH